MQAPTISLQLAIEIVKGDRLRVHFFHHCDLLLIQKLQFVGAQISVAIGIHLKKINAKNNKKTDASEPKFEAGGVCLVFLRKNEPHKVLVTHLAIANALSKDGRLLKDAVDDETRQRSIGVFDEIVLGEEQIVV